MFSVPMRITVRLDGSDAVFTADVFESGCDITFGSGHVLEGTELRFRAEGNTATLGDFTREIKSGTFPAQEALVRAVRLLATAEIDGVFGEGQVKYTIDEMTIMVYYDKDTDKVIGIGTEERGRRFEFSIAALEPYEAQSNGTGQH